MEQKPDSCAWYCSGKPVIWMYHIYQDWGPHMKVRLQPYCASCATWLIENRSTSHLPFKHYVRAAHLTFRLE